MIKKNNKLLFSAFIILVIFSVIGSTNSVAVGTPNQIINVQGDSIQTQLQSNIRTMFCFQERTRLTICSNVGLNLEIECEALKIGDNDIIIEIEGEGDLKMTMKCTREESQLGLMNGSLHRARDRKMYRYLEGFCISMACKSECDCQCKCDPLCTCECDCQCKCDPLCTCECDCQCKCDPLCTCECDCQCKCDPLCTCECDCQCKCDPLCSCECDCQCKCDPLCTCKCDCQCKCDPDCMCNPECPNEGSFLKATLRIRATNQNHLSQWAYLDEQTLEWVTVSTTTEENYLTAEVTSLSTWTVLVPETVTTAMGGTTVIIMMSVLGILVISVFYLKKRS